MRKHVIWAGLFALWCAACIALSGCGSTTLYNGEGQPVAQAKRLGWASPDLSATVNPDGSYSVQSGREAWARGSALGGQALDVAVAALPLLSQMSSAGALPRPVQIPESRPTK